MGNLFQKLKKIFLEKNEEINLDDMIELKEDADFSEGKVPTFLKTKEEIEKEGEKYPFPIKKRMAIDIARQSNTLKTDFCRNSNRECVSFLGFFNYDINLIEKDGKKYWQYEVFDGDISWIEYDKKERETYCDGKLSSDDLKYLRCLIDTETGEYIYYPEVENYKKRTVEYKKPGEIRYNFKPLLNFLNDNDKDVEE